MLTSEQVASSGCNNFSFFNRRASIESAAELADYLTGSLLATRQDIAAGRLGYDPAVTYMSLIVGDGDDIAFMKGGRRDWMEERVSYCQSKGECSVQVIMTDVLWEDHYITLERKVFVFKLREWRRTNPDGVPPFSGGNYLTEINSYSSTSTSPVTAA